MRQPSIGPARLNDILMRLSQRNFIASRHDLR